MRKNTNYAEVLFEGRENMESTWGIVADTMAMYSVHRSNIDQADGALNQYMDTMKGFIKDSLALSDSKDHYSLLATMQAVRQARRQALDEAAGERHIDLTNLHKIGEVQDMGRARHLSAKSIRYPWSKPAKQVYRYCLYGALKDLKTFIPEDSKPYTSPYEHKPREIRDFSIE